jgi:hypothetical protein
VNEGTPLNVEGGAKDKYRMPRAIIIDSQYRRRIFISFIFGE